MSKHTGLQSRGAPLAFDWKVLAIQMVFSTVIAVGLGQQVLKTGSQPDFTAFWAAQHVALPYNPAILSGAAGPNATYYPYPPTFLFLTLPLHWIARQAGYFGWIVISACALVASLRRLWAPLLLAVPAVLMAVIAGQTSLLMGALLFVGATLGKRPLVAGALFGVAACIKPQVVVLLPLVLLFAAQWRMLASAAATGLLVCLAATLLYGAHIWADWLLSLPGWLRANDSIWAERYVWAGRFVWAGRYLALPGLWKIAALGAGAVASAFAARRGQIELGIFIATAAALLGSLHAMDYDGAILAPFALAAALSNRWLGVPFAAAIAIPPNPFTVLVIAVLAAGSLMRRSGLPIRFQQTVSKHNENMI